LLKVFGHQRQLQLLLKVFGHQRQLQLRPQVLEQQRQQQTRLRLFYQKPLQLHGHLFEKQPQRCLSDSDLD
jgi:hypothetical protein